MENNGLVDDVKLRKDFWDTINNRTKVSVNLLTDEDVESFTADNGDVIFVIHVPIAKREQKPVYINDDIFNGTFRRNWESDYHCDRNEVLVMLRDEQYLEKIGAASIYEEDGQLHPTAAGLLMFGEEYRIAREFPEYFLDYREMPDPSIRWTDRL